MYILGIDTCLKFSESARARSTCSNEKNKLIKKTNSKSAIYTNLWLHNANLIARRSSPVSIFSEKTSSPRADNTARMVASDCLEKGSIFHCLFRRRLLRPYVFSTLDFSPLSRFLYRQNDVSRVIARVGRVPRYFGEPKAVASPCFLLGVIEQITGSDKGKAHSCTRE